MATFRISLFGKMTVAHNGTRVEEDTSSKARELLAYLLVHRRRSHPRERLGSLLWSHVSTSRSKAYLRKALWQIQQTLSDDAADDALLVVEGTWVRVNPDADLWLDVDVFEAASAAVWDRDVASLTSDDARALSDAVVLYTSDLLENWYDDWCLLERERLQDRFLMMLDKLAHYSELHGAYDSGVEHGQRMLHVDPARECAHRRLMRLRYLSGDRTGALRQYNRCAAILQAELAVEPSARTQRLHEQIQADTLTPLEPPLSGPLLLGPSERGSVAEGMERIHQLQRTLAGLQSKIHREIEAVELAIERKR